MKYDSSHCRNLLFQVPLPKSSHCFLCIFSENRHSLSTQIYTWICGPLSFLLSGSLPSTLYYTWVFWFYIYETVFHICSYEGHRWPPCVQIQGHLSVVPLRHQLIALSPRQAACTRLPGLVLSWVSSYIFGSFAVSSSPSWPLNIVMSLALSLNFSLSTLTPSVISSRLYTTPILTTPDFISLAWVMPLNSRFLIKLLAWHLHQMFDRCLKPKLSKTELLT